MGGLLFAVVLGTTIWVYFDAKSIGVRKGQIKGIADMGPGGWFWACGILWVFAFPLYLVKRGEYKRINQISPRETQQENLKRCPFCAEMIQKEAKVCKHCGRDLPQYRPFAPPQESSPVLNRAVSENAEQQQKERNKPAVGNSTKYMIVVFFAFAALLVAAIVSTHRPTVSTAVVGPTVLSHTTAQPNTPDLLKGTSSPPDTTLQKSGEVAGIVASAPSIAPSPTEVEAIPPREGLQLRIDARGPVWLSITADGAKQWQGTLRPNQTREVQATESVRVTVGDAGAVELSLNGKPLPPLGRPGEVKSVTITAKGTPEPAP